MTKQEKFTVNKRYKVIVKPETEKGYTFKFLDGEGNPVEKCYDDKENILTPSANLKSIMIAKNNNSGLDDDHGTVPSSNEDISNNP